MKRFVKLTIALFIVVFPAGARAWQPGTHPVAPARMHSSGFSVDTQDRNDVIAFWHAVYQASEGYETRIAWTGNYSGTNGTTSPAFVEDVERRVNYFRAMCGVPADVQLDSASTVRINAGDEYKPPSTTLKTTAAQDSALMLSRNYSSSSGSNPAFSHDPPSGITGFNAITWNANSKSNLAFGSYGPGAITVYMLEELGTGFSSSSWNSEVGHRRWMLLPQATTFATGDQPGTSVSQPPTNVLYIRQRGAEEATGIVPTFVTYPSAGFFPAPINSRFWSISRKGADFTNATASVTTAAGAPVTPAAVIRHSGFGDPAIILDFGVNNAIKSVTSDTTYHVTVSGIAGADVPSSHSYSVTLVNPDLLNSDQSLTGAGAPPAGASATYFLAPPPDSEGTEVAVFQPFSSVWNEGAQPGPPAPLVIDRTHPSYDLISTPASYASFGNLVGNRAFRLTFPVNYDLVANGVPQQSFELDRNIVPKAGAALAFKFRRGYFTTTSRMAVESSADDGSTWSLLGSAIAGVSNSNFDGSTTSATRDLALSNVPIRIRFRIYHTGGSIYTHASSPGNPTGIFVDDITTTNCDWLEKKGSHALPAGEERFTLDDASAGIPLTGNLALKLRMRTRLGGRWFHYGPVKSLTVAPTPLTGYAAWTGYDFPVLRSGFTEDDDGDGLKNGIEYAFSLDPLKSSSAVQTLTRNSVLATLSLGQPLPALRTDIQYRAEWSPDLAAWSESGVIVTTTGGQALAIAPLGAGARFLRWKIMQP